MIVVHASLNAILTGNSKFVCRGINCHGDEDSDHETNSLSVRSNQQRDHLLGPVIKGFVTGSLESLSSESREQQQLKPPVAAVTVHGCLAPSPSHCRCGGSGSLPVCWATVTVELSQWTMTMTYWQALANWHCLVTAGSESGTMTTGSSSKLEHKAALRLLVATAGTLKHSLVPTINMGLFIWIK